MFPVSVCRQCACRSLECMTWALRALNKPGHRKADMGTAVPSCPNIPQWPFLLSAVLSLSGRDTHWGVAGSLPPLAAVGMLFTHVVTKLLILFAAPQRPQLLLRCSVGQREFQSLWCSAQPGWKPISVNPQPQRGFPFRLLALRFSLQAWIPLEAAQCQCSRACQRGVNKSAGFEERLSKTAGCQ